MNDEACTIDAPQRILDGIAAAELKAPLPPSIAKLVGDALDARTWTMLATASRALRILVRLAREDRRPIPTAILDALADVRAAMSVLRGGR